MITEEDVDRRLTTPSPGLVHDLADLDGDLLVLGAGGKLGPSLVGLAVNALRAGGNGARVLAVSRYSDPASRDRIEAAGGVPVSADMLSPADVAALPDARNIVYLIGAKFGTRDNAGGTWVTNSFLPGVIMQRFQHSRISALSTGNVYPFVDVDSGGSVESDALDPVGEYAMSCLGRERVLSYFSETMATPLSLIRLNYAVETRYGVLMDLAETIARRQPVDVTTGFVNIIWQGYANEVILRSLTRASAPPFALNVAGEARLQVAWLAQALGERLGVPVEFTGSPATTALLSDASLCTSLFGEPEVGLDELLDMTAAWMKAALPRLGKPTKFQIRDGKF
jgi:nucleoside-diphosphate-sugar epimerase